MSSNGNGSGASAGSMERAKLLIYSRPIFRTCEIVCNHLARIAEKGDALSGSSQMAGLNDRRAKYQRVLKRLGGSHGDVCADCQGRCCHGHRERDAFTDRVLQDPSTASRNARRKEAENTTAAMCPNLTEQGCKLAHEDRPVQCAAYFCQAAVKSLSGKQCDVGAKSIAALMGVQMSVVKLALSSRFRG